MITKIAKSYSNELYKKFYYENYPGDRQTLDNYFNSLEFDDSKAYLAGVDTPKVPLGAPVYPVNPKLPGVKLKLLGGISKLLTGGGFTTSELLSQRRKEKGKITFPKGIYLTNPKRFYNRLSSPWHSTLAPPKSVLHNLVALHKLYEGKASSLQVDPKAEYDYSDLARIGAKHLLGIKLQNEHGDTTKFLPVGMHINLGVLGNEANDVLSVAENADSQDMKDLKKLITLRKKSKEIDILKGITNRQYGKDKFTNEDLLKLRTLLARDKSGAFIHKLENVYRDKENNPVITPSLKIVE